MHPPGNKQYRTVNGRKEIKKYELDEIRTRNLQDWNLTRYRCATNPYR